jgi:hypothetical protein
MKTIIFGTLMLISGISFGQLTINVSNATSCDMNVRFYINDSPDLLGCLGCSINFCVPSGTIALPLLIPASCSSYNIVACDVSVRDNCSAVMPCTGPSGNLTSPPPTACYPTTLLFAPMGGCGCGGGIFNITWSSSTDLSIS